MSRFAGRTAAGRVRGQATRVLCGAGLLTWLLACGALSAAAQPPATDATAELAAARQVFAANLDAIQRRDRTGYLGCYLNSPLLAVTGARGFALGYDPLAASTGSGWPDFFEIGRASCRERVFYPV